MSGRFDSTGAPISWLWEGFPSEGFTPIPHDLLDWIGPVLSEAELRILIYICRRTYGFGKQSDRISLNQFCAGPTSRSGAALDLGTGLSRQGVLNAIDGLEAKGVIKVLRGSGRGQISQYQIHLSPGALARIEELQITPREMVNAVDRLSKSSARCSPTSGADSGGSRRGQPLKDLKDNLEDKKQTKAVHPVDPQEKEKNKRKGLQQKVSFAQNVFLNPKKTNSPKGSLEQMLVRTTEELRTKPGTTLPAVDHKHYDDSPEFNQIESTYRNPDPDCDYEEST